MKLVRWVRLWTTVIALDDNMSNYCGVESIINNYNSSVSHLYLFLFIDPVHPLQMAGRRAHNSRYSDPRCNNTLKGGSPQRLAVCKNWTDWPTADLRAYLKRQGQNVLPISNGIEFGGDLPCGGRMEMNGAAFVHSENPPTTGCGQCYARCVVPMPLFLHSVTDVPVHL